MSDQQKSNPTDKKSPSQDRKMYTKPQLIVYGDLAEITRNNGTNATRVFDGNGHPNKHYTA